MSFRFSLLAFGALAFAFACLEDPKLSSDDDSSGGNSTGGRTFGGGSTSGGATGGNASGGVGGHTGGKSGTGGVASGGSPVEPMGGEAGSAGRAEGGGDTAGAGGAGASSGAEGPGGEGGAGGVEVAGGSGGGGNEGGAIEIGASVYPFPAGEDDIAPPSGTAGGLEVLDWAGFKSAISYTFDDTNSSQIQHYSELQALGVRLTFYLQTNKTSDLNSPIWPQAVADGHEIGNHTVHHLQEADLNALAEPGEEIDQATRELEAKFGTRVWTMAAPYGADAYAQLSKTRFFINRGVSPGLMLPNNDTAKASSIYCSIPDAASTASVFNALVDSARSAGGWRVFLVHGFIGGTDGAYNAVDITEFTTSVAYTKGLGDVWIDSVANIGSYWVGQKAFSAATTNTSGGESTWTWHLPAYFPRGQYLRVKVDGGTLKQGDTTLAWNGHGFYEVNLDYGSLSLSP
jgi:peptidoglycan/xylan/chitin deacetylase (PgdA/CDA1 family)